MLLWEKMFLMIKSFVKIVSSKIINKYRCSFKALSPPPNRIKIQTKAVTVHLFCTNYYRISICAPYVGLTTYNQS